jgi:Leu/Phe-tRNA-protein transferase
VKDHQHPHNDGKKQHAKGKQEEENYVCNTSIGEPDVKRVLVVFHQGLFQLCNQGSDLLTLGRPGRMILKMTPIRL